MNKDHIVSIARCSRYQANTLRDSLLTLLEPWGGIGALIKPGQKVLLKPNLLAAARPEEAVTTHPALVKALTIIIQEEGGKVFIGDSPGTDEESYVHRETGMQLIAEETGAQLIRFDRAYQKDYDGIRKRRLELATAIETVDIIINLAKLKTHPLTGLTGAVKNIYGCISGKKKARLHLDYPLPLEFSRLLVDVCQAVKPAFSIIDAVIGMEGRGPRRGNPRQIGLLLASINPFALDTVAAAVVGLNPGQVTTLKVAEEVSIPGTALDAIEINGVSLNECRLVDFDTGTVTSGSVARLITRFPIAWARDFFEKKRPYPVINRKVCNGCGNCVEGCPAQIISGISGIPDIDLTCCIRCYCCQEFCPQGAIDLSG